MPSVFYQCPRCGHKFAKALPADTACPSCGIYLFQWQPTAEVTPEDELPVETHHGTIASLFQPLEKLDETGFYGRATVLAGLTIWSWFLFGYDYRTGEIRRSFMHSILLPIHEAGHMFFRIFGEFMMVLGGSLFQLLLPFAIGVAFIVKRRDNFGAAVCCWWTSVSLLDLSPYIYDALHPQLVLLGGLTGDEGGPHDWIYLLDRLGQLSHAQGYGAFAHFFGGILMVCALVWGLTILLRQRSRLGDTAE